MWTTDLWRSPCVTDFETISELLRDGIIRTYSKRIGRQAAEDCYQQALASMWPACDGTNIERTLRARMASRVKNYLRDNGRYMKAKASLRLGLGARAKQKWDPKVGPPGPVVVYGPTGEVKEEVTALEWKRRQLADLGGGS